MNRRDFERQLHEKDREINWLRTRVVELENRLMVMADKPWTPPPILTELQREEEEDEAGWVRDPEQSIGDFVAG